MPKVAMYNFQGKKVKDLTLEKNVFDIEIKEEVVHKAVKAQLSNRRSNIAHTKDRSEVRGGGAKPWRQKGTGRARHGSNRSPIWIGGGITFGPRNNRNFKKKINKKERVKALLMTLTAKTKEKKLFLLEDIKLDKISTKAFAEKMKKLPTKEGSTLVVLSKKNEKVLKSSANLKNIKVVNVSSLSIYDILSYEFLIMTKETIENFQKTYK